VLERNEVGDKRLTGRVGEGAAGPEQDHERIDPPDLRRPAPGDQEQAQRGQGAQNVADDKDQPPVEPVGDMAGEEREPDRRQEGDEPDQAQSQRIAGKVVDQPADRHVLHLHRDAGQEPAREEEREVAVLERHPSGTTFRCRLSLALRHAPELTARGRFPILHRRTPPLPRHLGNSDRSA
jgi:hypothetical protein